MGESVCVMPQFSYSGNPNSAQELNQIHALGQSISFGRFTSESLAWEKWSTFSHKKYVEEAERYSRPGSVAQKKAFFEAHYKKIAAKKAEAASIDHVQKQDVSLNVDEHEAIKSPTNLNGEINNSEMVNQDLPKKNPAGSPVKSTVQIHANKENNDPLEERKPMSNLIENSSNFTPTRIKHMTPDSENKRTKTSLNSSTPRSRKGGRKSRFLGTKMKKLGNCLCFKAQPTLPDL